MTLGNIKGLLTEFYEGKDTSAKASLSQTLTELRQRPEAWREALRWLEETDSMYVQYFAASSLEEAMRTGFRGAEGRRLVRHTVFGVLLAKRPLPPAVRVRLVKVVVDVGARSWPEEAPGFLDDILGCEDPVLGLELLHIVAQEFSGKSRNVTARRGRELSDRLKGNLPRIMSVLTQALRQGYKEALPCLKTLISWAPLAEHVTVELVELLFLFIKKKSRDAVEAVDAVLAKRLVPPSWARFVFDVGANLLQLLELDLDDDDDFVAAVCELVATFVEQHLPRVVNSGFPINELLQLLAKLLLCDAVNAGSLNRTLRPWETVVECVPLEGVVADGVAGVLESLLRRLLFATNSALEDIDDETDKVVWAVDDDQDDLEVDDVVTELAGGSQDARFLAASSRNDELWTLLDDSIDLIGKACQASSLVAERLARSALTELQAALNRAFAANDRFAATDAATLFYAVAAAAPFADAVLAEASHAVSRAAVVVLSERAHSRGPAFVSLEAASLDSAHSMVPALAWRASQGDGDAAAVVDCALQAAALALDASVSPPPEAVQRAGAWLVLAVAKRARHAPALASLPEVAWNYTATTAPRCRALVYRAAAAVVAPDPLEPLIKPLAAPLDAAANAIAPLSRDALLLGAVVQDDVLDAKILDTVKRAARCLAALCAGAWRDGKPRSLFFDGNGSSTRRALETAPALLAYCAARALRAPGVSSDPRAARLAASVRAPHLAAAAALVDLLVAASWALGHEKAGVKALEAVAALLAAFDVGSPAAAFDSSAQSRPPRAAALYLVKATCRLVATVAADAKRAVPQVCDLAVRHVAPLARTPDLAAELLPPLLALCKRLLVDQWSAFVVAGKLKDARRFDDLMSLVLLGARGSELPSACVARALAVLHDAHKAHRLYDLHHFVDTWREPAATVIFDAIFDRRHELVGDTLASVLFDLAASDAFFQIWLPSKIEGLPGLDDDHKRVVVANFNGATDHQSFAAAIADAINDVDHFRALLRPTD